MALELGNIPIEEIEWGRKTALEGTVLRVHREGLIEKTRGGTLSPAYGPLVSERKPPCFHRNRCLS